jgi:hypothetical protein
MNRISHSSIPEATTEKMKDFLEKKLFNNKMFKYNSSRLETYTISEYNWFGNITAKGIINLDGISDIRITSVDSITATMKAFYDGHIIASFTIIYFSDDNIVIPDFEFIINSMNLSICSSCQNHKDHCVCNEINEAISNDVMEVMDIINNKDLSKTRIFDPDELLGRIETPCAKEEPEKPGVDLVKFEPIIMGIATTLGYNKKKVEAAAIKVLTSNPDITDNNLATEIMRNIKG